jgi:predicted PurR-regulated permease PerM
MRGGARRITAEILIHLHQGASTRDRQGRDRHMPGFPTKKALLGEPASNPDWARRRDIALSILGWFIILAIGVWAASHIIGALLTVMVAALLAYAIYPLIRAFSRVLPRFAAIALAYLLVIGALGVVGYFVVNTAVEEIIALTKQIAVLLQPGANGAPSRLTTELERLGISSTQISNVGNQIVGEAQALAGSAVPVIAGIFGGIVSFILVIVLSIYLAIDGYRAMRWLRTKSPLKLRPRVNFVITTFERVVGGYIRGQILLSALVGVLVSAGMALLHVPYAVLLGLLAFLLEFIPIIGVFISGAACVLLALTQSFVLAFIVLLYFAGVHIIEGDVVGPRIVGRAIGLHPAVSIFALLAGAELFGLWGALFASPVVGVIQAVVVEIYREWRETHPQQFPEEYGPTQVPVTTQGMDPSVSSPRRTALWRLPPGDSSGGATRPMDQTDKTSEPGSSPHP